MGIGTTSYEKTYTIEDGSYCLPVSTYWTGNVKPESYGWSFIPAEIPYSNLKTDIWDQDFLG